MKKKTEWLLLAIILGLGIFLRFYKLGVVPNGLAQDETSLGYNALSILQTGKDEHGIPYPISFAAFGEYKLAGYVYLSVPSAAVFGNTPLGIRLPSAVCGSLSILVMYLLVKKMSGDKKLALMAAGLLTINPWHVNFSRAAFEVVPALLLMMMGTWLWFLGLKVPEKSQKVLKLGLVVPMILAASCFVGAIYTYNICKLLAPLLCLWLMWISKKELKGKLKQLVITGGVAIILLIPFGRDVFLGSGYSSTTGTLINSSAVVQAPLLETRTTIAKASPLLAKLIFNTPAQTVYVWGQHAVDYLSGSFFFAHGSEHGSHGIGEMGNFYLWEIISMGAGIVWLVRKREVMREQGEERELKLVIGGWILLNIGVAALTREAPHGTRGFFLIAPLAILSALGIREIEKKLKMMKDAATARSITGVGAGIAVAGVAAGLVMSWCFIYYLGIYYKEFPVKYAESWHAEDQQLMNYIKKNYDEAEALIIDSQAFSNFIYSSIAYNLPIAPEVFQTAERENDEEGFSLVRKVAKFEFREVDWEKDRGLVITKSTLVPEGKNINWRAFYPAYREWGAANNKIYDFGEKQSEAYVGVKL